MIDFDSITGQPVDGLAVSSMDMDFDGRVAGLKCCDVLLLRVFSARAAILSGRGHAAGRKRSKVHSAIARCAVGFAPKLHRCS